MQVATAKNIIHHVQKQIQRQHSLFQVFLTAIATTVAKWLEPEARATLRSAAEAMAGNDLSAQSSTAKSSREPVTNLYGYEKMRLEDLKSESQKPESKNRSLNRRKDMTRKQKMLCAAIGESDHLWYALRKHGSEPQCESWLGMLAETSNWKVKRREDDELLRKEYLQLWKECRHYKPDYVDTTMQERQEKAGIKTWTTDV